VSVIGSWLIPSPLDWLSSYLVSTAGGYQVLWVGCLHIWYRLPADTKSIGLVVFISGIGCRPIPSPVGWLSSYLVSAASRYT
jgi:hypothetical protein